jgi:hypothetical protein
MLTGKQRIGGSPLVAMTREKRAEIEALLKRGKTDEAIAEIVTMLEDFGDQPRTNALLLELIYDLQARVKKLETNA